LGFGGGGTSIWTLLRASKEGLPDGRNAGVKNSPRGGVLKAHLWVWRGKILTDGIESMEEFWWRGQDAKSGERLRNWGSGDVLDWSPYLPDVSGCAIVSTLMKEAVGSSKYTKEATE